MTTGRFSDGFRLAVGTLTALPIRPPTVIDRERSGLAMLLAPIAVLPLAMGVGLVGWLGSWLSAPPMVTAALVVALLALGSRALHLDGLADTADGLTASYHRAKALEIMARGNIGPAGAAALVITLVIQISALASVLTRPWGPVAAGLIVVVSRSGLALACVRGIPAARPGGLGAMVAGALSAVNASIAGLFLAAGLVGAAVLIDKPWWQGLIVFAGVVLGIGLLVRRCCRRLGGITGDVLGATVEISAAVITVGLAAGPI